MRSLVTFAALAALTIATSASADMGPVMCGPNGCGGNVPPGTPMPPIPPIVITPTRNVTRTRRVVQSPGSGRVYVQATFDLYRWNTPVARMTSFETFTGRALGFAVSTPTTRTSCIWDGTKGFNQVATTTVLSVRNGVTTKTGSEYTWPKQIGFHSQCTNEIASALASGGVAAGDMTYFSNAVHTFAAADGSPAPTPNGGANAGAWSAALAGAAAGASVVGGTMASAAGPGLGMLAWGAATAAFAMGCAYGGWWMLQASSTPSGQVFQELPEGGVDGIPGPGNVIPSVPGVDDNTLEGYPADAGALPPNEPAGPTGYNDSPLAPTEGIPQTPWDGDGTGDGSLPSGPGSCADALWCEDNHL